MSHMDHSSQYHASQYAGQFISLWLAIFVKKSPNFSGTFRKYVTDQEENADFVYFEIHGWVEMYL
jgi:hypothetical protein